MAVTRSHSHLFTLHSRHWEKNRYVYPVVSRRSKGLSIGINLNTDRICNFDCIYCCVDRTQGVGRPEPVDVTRLRRELELMLAAATSGEIWKIPPFDTASESLRRFADVAFSGDGEPTTCPVFGECCHIAADLLGKYESDAKIVLITNASMLDRPAVRETLRFLDQHRGEIWAKLDAGNERVYREVVRTTIPMKRILDNILLAGRERPIVIQSMFLKKDGVNPAEGDIADYLERLRELKQAGCQIRLVQVYTVARPVFETAVTPADDAVLDDIAAGVKGLGLAAEAYYGARPG